jgi:predicted Zn-dependent protease with MMP-like domain
VIYLFQGSIEEICKNSQELIQQVRKTVLHEIGHHFGMSEEDLRRLGYG